ncbi:BrnA antitoxin family protein [Bradyrhizobium sp. AZCC 1610]|uniref:BrnA antitoxin family protein n=1 Tax=Bradyrhizobium sp. AZCC 1610 TaxID=3117020 RepID=UPI002FF147F3
MKMGTIASPWRYDVVAGHTVRSPTQRSPSLTREQRAELKSLAALRDDAIDTSDAPEILDWSDAKRGLFYRPVKQRLPLRLDADVVAWFKSRMTSNEGYQTRINRALREYVQGQASELGDPGPNLAKRAISAHSRCGDDSAVFVGRWRRNRTASRKIA